MQKRIFSREFKLDLMRQITSGQKRYSQVCHEYSIAKSMLSRLLREYRERGESAFLPKEPEKEFDVSSFVYHQKEGPVKLEAEIAKCDILCANCHLKYHYDNDQRRLRGLVESVIDQIEKAEQAGIPTQEEEIAYAVYKNYFPEGTDTDCLMDGLYENLLYHRSNTNRQLP